MTKKQDEYIVDVERKKFHKFFRKKNIKYVRCQHLREGVMKEEAQNMWIGEKERIILCPICAKAHLGHTIRVMMTMPRYNIEDLIKPDEDDRFLAPVFWDEIKQISEEQNNYKQETKKSFIQRLLGK